MTDKKTLPIKNKSGNEDNGPVNLQNISAGAISAPQMPKYQSAPTPGPNSNAPAIDFDKIKTKLENFRKVLIKKFGFTMALSILPGPAAPIIEDDEAIAKEIAETRPLYMLMIIPADLYNALQELSSAYKVAWFQQFL